VWYGINNCCPPQEPMTLISCIWCFCLTGAYPWYDSKKPISAVSTLFTLTRQTNSPTSLSIVSMAGIERWPRYCLAEGDVETVRRRVAPVRVSRATVVDVGDLPLDCLHRAMVLHYSWSLWLRWCRRPCCNMGSLAAWRLEYDNRRSPDPGTYY